jgi:hypothetical protein
MTASTALVMLGLGLAALCGCARQHGRGESAAATSPAARDESMSSSPATSAAGPPDAALSLDAAAAGPLPIPGPLDGAITAPVGSARPPEPATDAAKFREVIAAQIHTQYAMPAATKLDIDFVAGGPRRIGFDPGEPALTVIPLIASFSGQPKDVTFCKFAVFAGDRPNPGLVPLELGGWDFPEFNDCKKVRKLAETDLNHDGIPDFIFVLTVASFRDGTLGEEGAVYVSVRDAMTYCPAPDASRIVTIMDHTGPAAVRGIASEVKRRGEVVLACPKRA